MQEKTDPASAGLGKRRNTTQEERQFQVENWKKSGLTMSEYCRQNNLPLVSLSAWKHSMLRKNITFKPVQSLPPAGTITKPSNVVEIMLDHRIKIRLQPVVDASLVIDIVKGLMTCN